MAIQANITSSRFGTTHEKAYVKITRVTADHIRKLVHVERATYNSAEDYLNGKDHLYIEGTVYKEEDVKSLWNTEEPTHSTTEMYRLTKLDLDTNVEIVETINLIDVRVIDEGGLDEKESDELAEIHRQIAAAENKLDSIMAAINALNKLEELDAEQEEQLTSLQDSFKGTNEALMNLIARKQELENKVDEEGRAPSLWGVSLKDEPEEIEYVEIIGEEYKVDEEKMAEVMGEKS